MLAYLITLKFVLQTILITDQSKIFFASCLVQPRQWRRVAKRGGGRLVRGAHDYTEGIILEETRGAIGGPCGHLDRMRGPCLLPPDATPLSLGTM